MLNPLKLAIKALQIWRLRPSWLSLPVMSTVASLASGLFSKLEEMKNSLKKDIAAIFDALKK